MQGLQEILDAILGIGNEPASLTVGQVAVRATLIYMGGWLMLRLGEHRFLGKHTAFDVVLGFIFGSMLARAINGSAPFFETMAAGVVLVFLHWLFVVVAFRSDRGDRFLNGTKLRLIQNGKVKWNEMRKARVSMRILEENLRLNGHVRRPEEVAEADYEPTGNISVIPAKKEYRVVEVDVRDGVQTVRVELVNPNG